jgi:hypothetical protein
VSPSSHGRPPQPAASGRSLRGLPRSRAFWELKAEQMMNRIFDPEDPIDLSFETASPEREGSEASTTAPSPAAALAADAAVLAAAAPTATTTVPAATAPATVAPATTAEATTAEATTAEATAAEATPGRPRNRPGRAPRRERPQASGAIEPGAARTKPGLDDRLVLGSALAGVCLLSVAGSLVYFGYWNRLQQNLAQERNLLLVERLRSLGPANPAPAPAPAAPLAAPGLPAAPDAAAAPGGEGLPPPPPEEPWMQQLSTLPSPAAPPPRVLTVPVSPRLGAAAPAAAAPAATPAAASRPPASRPPAASPVPLQLVGVVGGAGRSSSAIFLVGGSSMSVNSGEMIGSSGWRLRSAEGETALIERDGDVRQVSIASGNGF